MGARHPLRAGLRSARLAAVLDAHQDDATRPAELTADTGGEQRRIEVGCPDLAEQVLHEFAVHEVRPWDLVRFDRLLARWAM